MSDFFTKLAESMDDGMSVSITILKKGKEKIVTTFLPIPKGKKANDCTPFSVSGTGPEVDSTFEPVMIMGTQKLSGFVQNAEEFLVKAGYTKKEAAQASMNFDADSKGTKTTVKAEKPPKEDPIKADVPEESNEALPEDPLKNPNTDFDKQGPFVSDAEAPPVEDGSAADDDPWKTPPSGAKPLDSIFTGDQGKMQSGASMTKNAGSSGAAKFPPDAQAEDPGVDEPESVEEAADPADTGNTANESNAGQNAPQPTDLW